MKVKCPNCKAVMWQTTDQFDPDKTPHGAMLELLPPWKDNSWPIYGDGVMIASSTTACAEMDCPQCLAQLAPSGRLTIVPEEVPQAEEAVQETEEVVQETEETVQETAEVAPEPVTKPRVRRKG